MASTTSPWSISRGHDLERIIEYCAAHDLPIPPEIAYYIVAETAEGLHYAHCAADEGEPLNIVHRDVSPANIVVTAHGSVKVVDFGIAKYTGSEIDTSTGILRGKFIYMSPEQIREHPLDARSDVFSLGSVLYELLTLKPCFTGPPSGDPRRHHQRSLPAARPSSSRFARAIHSLLASMLETNRARRTASAATVAQTLRSQMTRTGSMAARETATTSAP